MAAKPVKPSPDFPLFPHGNGQWAKKVKGKLRYFGVWDDPAAALAKFLDDREPQSNNSPVESEPRRKPRLDFPLSIHKASGRWYKKVRSRMRYFGKIADDPQGDGALRLWMAQKDDLLAGRKPREQRTGGVTVDEVVNRFLVAKRDLRDAGEIGQRTYDEYTATARMVQERFGESRLAADLGPDDFAELRKSMTNRWGPVRLGNEIQRVKSIFKHAEEFLDRPVQVGQRFKKPSAKVIRRSRAEHGPRDFTAEQLRAILAVANPNMKAMTLLSINGGFGNTDLGKLPIKSIDLDKASLFWPRTKTGMPRTVPLWPETVEAIQEALAIRQKPKDVAHVGLLFISPRRMSYVRKDRSYGLSAEFKRGLDKAGVEGHAFYDLRRTFQTVAEGTHDLAAVQAVMGHTPHTNDMSATYRQRVAPERLLAVTNYMRSWLFPRSA